MAEEPEKSGQEPNLELPSLLGFGRRKKKSRKTDPDADTEASDAVTAAEPAPSESADEPDASNDVPAADQTPQTRAGLAPATDRPKRKPPVPPPPATRPEPEVSREPEVAPDPEPAPEPATAPEPQVIHDEPQATPEPEVVPEPQAREDTEETQVIEEAPPPPVAAAPVSEAARMSEPVAASAPPEATQHRPIHEGRVGWSEEEPAEATRPPLDEPVEPEVAAGGARRERRQRQLPVINPRLAAAVTGGVVGLVGVALTVVAGRGCEAVRGVGSCGGIGLLALLLIVALEVLLGSVLLKAWRISDPTSTSFLGVGLAAVFVMLFLLSSLESVWMFLVIPLLSVVTFVVSWLVTETLGETSLDDMHR